MTASERARLLMADLRLKATLAAVYPTPMHRQGEARSAEALLAYVARLEACVAAARSLETCLTDDDIVCSADEREQRLFEALAALDRPEDGETK